MRPAILLAVALAGLAVSPSADQVRERYIRDTLGTSAYLTAIADLNGDGRPEVFVYETGADHCGSGGCDLVVLTPDQGSYRVVMDASVTRPPIRVLNTATHGWRDIGVFVAGGGILPGYTARLRFDGRRYPGNPTVPPATHLHRPGGRVLIAR